MSDTITVNLNTDRRGPAGPSEPATEVADLSALSALATSTAARFIKLADTDIEDGGLYFIPADGDGSAARQVVVANSSGAIGATLTVRRGTIASLASVVLAAGEIAVISDRGRNVDGTIMGLTVIGDGSSTVAELPWIGVDEIIFTAGGPQTAASNADTLIVSLDGNNSYLSFGPYGGGRYNSPRHLVARVNQDNGVGAESILMSYDAGFGSAFYYPDNDESGADVEATDAANPLIVVAEFVPRAAAFDLPHYRIISADNIAQVFDS